MLTGEPSSHIGTQAPASLGARLRQARDAQGLTLAQVSERLRLSHSVIEAMEADDFARLGAPIYQRGYYGSYARLLGLPPVVVEQALRQAPAVALPLLSSTYVPRSRFFVERLARRAVYVVLTASIVLPVIWLASQERLPSQAISLRALDAEPASTAPAVRTDAAVGPPEGLAGAGAADTSAQAADARPLAASMAPYFASQRASPAVAVDPPAADWELVFRADSWVEVVGRDGRRLEHGIVRAGETRRYAADQLGRVALGNAAGVELRRAGETVSLEPFRRANVARFEVSSAGELQPAGG